MELNEAAVQVAEAAIKQREAWDAWCEYNGDSLSFKKGLHRESFKASQATWDAVEVYRELRRHNETISTPRGD